MDLSRRKERYLQEKKRVVTILKNRNRFFNHFKVYTDGSCIENYASGIGIYFGPNHPLNKSKAIHGYGHNSGLAEIIAARTALKLLRKWDFYK